MALKQILTTAALLGTSLTGQNYVWPTDASHQLSSNFGEFRTTGYHLGIDIKTHEKEGFPVYAVSAGYISRMVTNFTGFGRALYLTTEDGKVAVYAHLSRFSPALEKRLKQEQERADSYLVNRYFKAAEFPVSKAEIIGFTGNTGNSFGPHLHFEIRNQDEQPLNPLTNGFPLDDRLSPILKELAVTPLGRGSWSNGSQLAQTFPLFRDRTGTYHFPDTLNVSGRVGLAVKTYDKRQGAKNVYQPHKLELWVDGRLHYKLTFDRLDYNLMSTANYVKDYRNARLNMGDFIKLYRLKATPAVPLFADSSRGVLDLTPGYHQIRIVVQDAAGNAGTVRGTLFSAPPFEIIAEVVNYTAASITFEFEPKALSIPLEKIICYSFTPYGYADRKVDILEVNKNKLNMSITIPLKQVNKRALQFIAINKLGAHSYPLHWEAKNVYGDHLNVDVDLDIFQSEGGIFIQVQTGQVIDTEVSLRLKGRDRYETIPLSQIRPTVFLTSPLNVSIFKGISQAEVILKGSVERQVEFTFPYTVAMPGTSLSILSEDKLCSIMTQAESLVDTTLMWIEPVHKYAQVEGGKFKSKVYQLQPYQVPLMKPVKIGIRYGNRLKHEPNLHLYYYDQKEGWTFIPTKINAHRQVLTGEVKHLDAVAIIQDVTAPEIRSMHPGNHGQYPAFELNRIQIRVEDKLSGIDPDEAAFQLILDDTPLRFAYQPRKKEISYALEEPLSMGEHTLTFQVHDRAGNKSEKTITFKVN